MSSVDKRYAEALVDAAEAKGKMDTSQSELTVFVEIYSKQPEFKEFFLSPEIGKREKKNVLNRIFNGADSIVLPFIQLLIDKDRISNLPEICKEYVEIADKRRRILNLTVRTFSPIDDMQLNKIIEKYMKEYDATEIKTTVSIEPELLGGIIVHIGDRVIDGSVKGRLNGLREATIKMQQLKVI